MQSGLCRTWSETPEDRFSRDVAHLENNHNDQKFGSRKLGKQSGSRMLGKQSRPRSEDQGLQFAVSCTSLSHLIHVLHGGMCLF